MRIKYILAAALAIIAISFILYSFQSSLTPYVSIREAKQNPGRVQIAGFLRTKSLIYRRPTRTVEFTIYESEGDTLAVHYDGAKLTNLNDVEKVVVIGTYHQDENMFYADEILAKCPSKYEGKLE